jgi:hypothetical protein
VGFDELDEIEGVRDVDEQLRRAFAGTSAPAGLASSVMNRVRMPAPTRLLELLDAIGWIGALSFTAAFTCFVIFK